MKLTGVIIDCASTKFTDSATGLLKIANETIIERQICLLKQVCQEIILVTNEPHQYLPIVGSSIRIITDYFKGSGALSGMHAALSLAKSDSLLVVTPDMPFLSVQVITSMLKDKIETGVQLVVPESQGQLQLFHSIYDRSCIKSTEKLIEEQDAGLVNILEHVSFKIIRNEDLLPISYRVQSMEDYQRAIQFNETNKIS
ncbi:molybdenum cofactor guanylyltransferase [Halalkalibacter krulwichiae]|uniref:Molybdopterin-guanine dinucleotide biosynthesis protein MobA n=1 Tax=Halalkalibacter krulwichiae TaxID=199441 RepID=A0A1X9MEG5_9BACI|nr:molybdenum cofactor guanylyltransferase [Halalkalibacter krulwichiae]ARK30523.1 molybdopterin-guanine dinucleotide biosynthesis protein MobA [Halalkalibacter krulwichiae]